MYSLNNYINTYKIEIYRKWFSRINKKKQKGDVSSKSIELFTIAVIMSCRLRDLDLLDLFK